MTKNLLIASAVSAALLAPSAALAAGHAKSGITVYGKAQLELVSTSDTIAGKTKKGISLDDSAENGTTGSGNASSLGVKGAHDIGGGLTATYNINFNFTADDNAINGSTKAPLKGRNSSIGLKGSFGSIEFGTVNSPYKISTVKWDPLLATFMQNRRSSGGSGLLNGYDDNVIAYKNKFGNSTVRISLDIDDNNDDANGDLRGDHGVSASINIPVSKEIELSLATHDKGTDDSTATKIAAKWKSGNKSAVIQFESIDKNGANDGEVDHLYMNFTVGTGNNGTVVVAFGSSDADDANTSQYKDGTYLALAYKKKLSKKVSAHVGFVSHDEGRLGQNNDTTQFGAGLRVAF